MAALFEVFVRKLFQRADGRNVLHKVAALAVADGDVLYALLRREQRFDDGDRMGNAGGHEGAGERAVGLAVDGNARFFIEAGQTVHILPVADGALHGDVFCVRQVVGDAAAFIAREAARIGDLGEKARIRSPVAHLDGRIEAVDQLAAAGNAVVDCREAVEHGTAFLEGFADARFRLFVAVLAGVAVDRGGQEIRLALVLQVGEQLDLILDERNARARLDQRYAAVLRVDQLLGEHLLVGQGFVVSDGFLKVYGLAGRPLLQHFFADFVKLLVGDAFILQVHRFQAPSS